MERTHTVTLYRMAAAVTKDASGAKTRGWAVATAGVRCTLQGLSGSVKASAAGREVNAQVQAFIPAGITVQPDDGVVITAGDALVGVGRTRFRVGEVNVVGGAWDTEALLQVTEEAIP